MSDILQRFLSLGLLDIGDDDSRLDKLRSAATDLQRRFVNEPRMALYHALMAYTPNVSAQDACFVEDDEVLQPHWETYKNRHSDVPREIFRAVSLQAVMAAAEESPAIKASITYGLRSLDEHPVNQKDGSLLQELYRGLEADLEVAATGLWRTDTVSQSVDVAPPAPPTINKAEAATFETMADAVDKGFKAATAPFGGIAAAQNKLRGLAISAVQRSELLWWKESLYSPLLNRSYRNVPAGVAALYMALDLENQVGRITPLSVDFFLREAVREILPGNSGSPLDWDGLVLQIASEGLAASVLSNTPSPPQRAGVRTLVEMLREGLQPDGPPSQKIGKRRSRNEQTKPIDLPRLSVRVHLELQALRCAAEKGDGKKL